MTSDITVSLSGEYASLCSSTSVKSCLHQKLITAGLQIPVEGRRAGPAATEAP